MRITRFLILWAAVCAAGCTWTTVEKVSQGDTTAGIRYSLPQPFLRLSPKNDGGMDVEVVYLPDPSNTYAISAGSVFAKYTLDVTLKDGMLDKVTYDPEATAVAEKAIGTAATLAEAHIKAAAAREAAADKKGGPEVPEEPPKAWSPVLLRIVNTSDGVSLLPVPYGTSGKVQEKLCTSITPGPKAPEPQVPKLSVSGSKVLSPAPPQWLRFAVDVSEPLVGLGQDASIELAQHKALNENLSDDYPVKAALQASGKLIIIDLHRKILDVVKAEEDKDFVLRLPVKYGPKGSPKDKVLNLDFRIEP